MTILQIMIIVIIVIIMIMVILILPSDDCAIESIGCLFCNVGMLNDQYSGKDNYYTMFKVN